MEKYRFKVRDFTKKAYKFWHKARRPRKVFGTYQDLQAMHRNVAPLDKGKVSYMRFGVPMVWREPQNHHDDCYICMVDMTGWNQQKKKEWCYPDIESARRPVLQCAEVPVSTFTSLPHLTEDETPLEAIKDTDSSCSNYISTSMGAKASSFGANPKPFSQGQLNDLMRDLNLSKESCEILASRLGEHGILDSETKITFFQNRDNLLLQFFTTEDDFVYCNNIPGLLAKMGLSNYNSDEYGDYSLTTSNEA